MFVLRDGCLQSYSAGNDERSATDFAIVAPVTAWARYLEALPPPAYHNLFAMLMRVEGVRISGDSLRFAQCCHLVRRILELARGLISGPTEREAAPALPPPGTVEPIAGGYLTVLIDGQPQRLYFETAGAGPDLLCLHTAGADSRQFYRLMNECRLTDHWRLVAFDLPGHGKSFPPTGAVPGSWALTTDRYVATILAVCDALGLRSPVALGASMAGEICLELAYREPQRFRAVIALEASERIEGRQNSWARHPAVNQTTFVPEWVHGLSAPNSPAVCADEIWWAYSQGGFGTFYGDILFYSGDWDARERVAAIDTSACPVYMLTGEYDYSCTPKHSEQTAKKISGAQYQTMHGLGHFPVAENPERFLGYLLPVLERIRAA